MHEKLQQLTEKQNDFKKDFLEKLLRKTVDNANI